MILRVIMSSTCALCCLPSRSKNIFPFRSRKNNTIFSFGFCHIQNNLGSVRVISLSFWLRLLSPASTLIILDITKTSSNSWIQHPSLINDPPTLKQMFNWLCWNKSKYRQKHKHLFDDGIVVYFKLVLLKQRS